MQLTNKEKLYDLIVNGLPVALFIVDGSYRIIEFNQAAEQITGWTREEVIGRCCADVLSSNLCRDNCPLRESFAEGKTCIGKEALISKKDGERIPIFFSSSALTDDQGNMIHGIEVFRDASAAKKLEDQKKNIISLFTHDLKSPVAIAGGFVDRLLKGKAGPLTEKQQGYLETVKKEIDRLERYILSFLEISRIEAGQIELHLDPLEIDALLQDIIEGFRLQAAQKNMRISLNMPENIPTLHGDSLQITRVFCNLMDNAIKYSERGKSVQVNVFVNSSGITIEVRDQGSGITPEQLEHIFDSFYRVPGDEKKAGGTGLGLAAVKAIVEAHGGKTWVKSVYGEGSSFYVFFASGMATS